MEAASSSKKCELHFLGSIRSAAPERAFGIRHVGDPFSVMRKLYEIEGFAAQVGQELVLLRKILNQLSSQLLAEYIHGCAISSEFWCQQVPWGAREFLRRVEVQQVFKTSRFRHRPDLGFSIMGRLEHEPFSVI